MSAEDLIAKWKKTLGLRGWTIRTRDEEVPAPSRASAQVEADFGTKTARVWAHTEQEVIHELSHVFLEGLDDAFWRANADGVENRKALDALWKRRIERTVVQLERILWKLSR